MINTNERIKNLFLPKHILMQDYLYRSKAISLMYILLLYFLLAAIVFIVLLFFAPTFLTRGIIQFQIYSLMLVSCISLIFLKNGNFSLSSNLILINVLLILIVGLFGKSNPTDCKLFVTNIYYMMSVIFFSSLFGSRTIITFMSVTLFICNIIFYIVTLKYFPSDFIPTAKLSILMGEVCITLITIIAFVILNISEGAIKMVNFEIKKNQELNSNLKLINEFRTREYKKVKEKQEKLNNEILSAHNGLEQMIRNTEDQSKKFNQVADDMLAQTKEGMNIIEKMVSSLSNIEKTNIDLNKINFLLREIITKTAMIDDIVFETKILSFNASIEAAHAGNNGNGFAVVASEVGNLAKMSGDTSSVIAALLEGGQQHVEEIILNIKKQVLEAKKVGTDSSKKFSETMNQVQRLFQQMQIVKDSVVSQQKIINNHLNVMRINI
ncbi:MAG: hypothetical protein HQK51_05405 [Oligoflexia bacterium]|nr:hypothetical protein [Oligoflexia bacterium]